MVTAFRRFGRVAEVVLVRQINSLKQIVLLAEMSEL